MTKKYQHITLEERTFIFAKKCRNFVFKLPKTVSNREYSKQLIRSSGSQAANYIEANEALSKKDFIYRVKIARKETKESGLWLRLCETDNDTNLILEQKDLIQESKELRSIFSTIIENSK